MDYTITLLETALQLANLQKQSNVPAAVICDSLEKLNPLVEKISDNEEENTALLNQIALIKQLV